MPAVAYTTSQICGGSLEPGNDGASGIIDCDETGQKKSANPATARRILAAAEHHFAAQGMAGARTEQIATAAHANKAMLYYYFGNKRHLHRAVLENLFRQLRTAYMIRSANNPPRANGCANSSRLISIFSLRIRIIPGWCIAKRWKPRKRSIGSCASFFDLFTIDW